MGRMTVIFSPSIKGNIFTIGLPREVRLPCGTSQTFSQYIRPRSEKHKIVSWVLATNKVSIQSSSFVVAACLPRPPRFCARYSLKGWLFMYPVCDRVTTISVGVIKSSVNNSVAFISIKERRPESPPAIPNSACTSFNSCSITCVTRDDFANKSSRSEISVITSLYSATILSCSRPVKRCKRICKISCAWLSDKRYKPLACMPYSGNNPSGR